jgi:ribonuclease VapC
MVIDTSALVAIALREPSRSALLDSIEAASIRLVSSVSVLETGMVLRARLGERSLRLLDRLLEEMGIEIAAFDAAQARQAIAAFGRFGKGMGHRAQLNFGDCAVYALAKLEAQPVLATGNDFTATDLPGLQP